MCVQIATIDFFFWVGERSYENTLILHETHEANRERKRERTKNTVIIHIWQFSRVCLRHCKFAKRPEISVTVAIDNARAHTSYSNSYLQLFE